MNTDSSIGQSISRCKHEIKSILSKWESTLGSRHFDLFRGMAENLIKEFDKEMKDFIGKASERAKSEKNTPVCTVKIEQNEHVPDDVAFIIDSDDERQVKTESINDVTAINRLSNRSIVDINPKISTQIDASVSCPSSSSASRVEKKSSGRKKTQFQCEVCSEKFRRTETLIFHRRIHVNFLSVYCRICLRSLASKAERDTHEIYCTRRRYECYVCSKILITVSHLSAHMRTHTGFRPFKCNFCSKRFVLKHGLTKHFLSQHNLQETIENTLMFMNYV